MSLEVNVTKRFDGFTLHAAFTAGDTATALLGASGCGKSMTLRCIAGIVRPDEGRIVLDGRVLFDSEQGTYHSTLTLSGTFNPEAGARFLQDVSELLASPVRLLI